MDTLVGTAMKAIQEITEKEQQYADAASAFNSIDMSVLSSFMSMLAEKDAERAERIKTSKDAANTTTRDKWNQLYNTGRLDTYEDYEAVIDRYSEFGDGRVSVCCLNQTNGKKNLCKTEQLEFFMKEYAQLIDKYDHVLIFVDAADDNMIDYVKKYAEEGAYAENYDVLWDESGNLDSIALFNSKDFIFKREPLTNTNNYLFYVGSQKLGTTLRRTDGKPIDDYLNSQIRSAMPVFATSTFMWFDPNLYMWDYDDSTAYIMLVPELVRTFSAGKYCAIGTANENYVGKLYEIDPHGNLTDYVNEADKDSAFTFVYTDKELAKDYEKLCEFVVDMHKASIVWQRATNDMNVNFMLRSDNFQELDRALKAYDEKEIKATRKVFEDVELFANTFGLTYMIDAVMNGVSIEDVLA